MAIKLSIFVTLEIQQTKIMLKLSFFNLAHAGEDIGHAHGPAFSATQVVGLLVIFTLAAGVKLLLSKK